jgi:hypothetical protein
MEVWGIFTITGMQYIQTLHQIGNKILTELYDKDFDRPPSTITAIKSRIYLALRTECYEERNGLV